jgi:hypothetical protein
LLVILDGEVRFPLVAQDDHPVPVHVVPEIVEKA